MTKKIRRVITGHNEKGEAICIKDTYAENIVSRPERKGVTVTNLWKTDSAPAQYDGPEETIHGSQNLQPPKHGSAFRIVDFEPEDPDFLASADGAKAFASIGAQDNIVKNARHPFMHSTETVDYGIVLSGEIVMLLDNQDILLKKGDTFIQRGTNHAWSNQSSETCQIAFVLIDAIENNLPNNLPKKDH